MMRGFMFRSFFIAISKIPWAQRTITPWGIARPMAARFVAGETPAEAIRVVKDLNAKNIQASLDHLGENTLDTQAAGQATADILLILDGIQTAGIRANVSIKLTQIGLALDRDLCLRNLESILERARLRQNFIRIDMEDSPFTESTLAIYEAMRQKGFDNLGVVIQAYLYRSEADIQRVVGSAGRVRLCKGAYLEPPEVAYPRKADVDNSYDRLAERLMEGALAAGAPELSADGRFPGIPALATHDPERIRRACEYAQAIGLRPQSYEFQMLYGIRRDLQEQLVRSGYQVRVYVPFGSHWYPYFMRRLAERPANIWFFISNFFRA